MSEERIEKRGGARPGSGPRRRRLYLDAETAKLLAEHMLQLNEPELTEEEAVKRLLLEAQIQREKARAEVTQQVQNELQQHWQSIMADVEARLKDVPEQIMKRLQHD